MAEGCPEGVDFELKYLDIIENSLWVMILSNVWIRIDIIYDIDK